MSTKDIAIIGMACRFPDAANYEQFWENLKKGVNSIKEIPPDRWDIQQFYSPNFDESNKSISKWCGIVDQIDQFDNRFFSISPREAKSMDPQQRLLLEEAWHCLEDAGVSLKRLQIHTTAVFVGVMAGDYHQESAVMGNDTDSYAALGSYDCILANRLSYLFGFRGPSESIGAACASSLVALHHAKVTLRSGESDYAIAAGVNLNLHPWKYISFSKSRMLSPDGQCKTFDQSANGYVPGDGVGVLLLQRLEDALDNRNHIYGILKGSAVNHGGQTLSITTPRVEAQQAVITEAYIDAGVGPDTVTYVEAHGTGTSLGDPIEVEALNRTFKSYTDDTQFCLLGSVKTNIGHLEAAAGVAGVIKVLLMLRHRQVPPTLNLKTLNPIINFDNSPFCISTELCDWQSCKPELPLRAGISSFGFGGVNSHVVIESYTRDNGTPVEKKTERQGFLFLLSAKSPIALKKNLETWQNFVSGDAYAAIRLEDLCATVITGRGHFAYRYGQYVTNKTELQRLIHQDCPELFKQATGPWCVRVGTVTWDYTNRMQSLIVREPLFHQHLEYVQQVYVQHVSQTLHKAAKVRKLKDFMLSYTFLSALMDAGFTPALVTSEGPGLWVSLCIKRHTHT